MSEETDPSIIIAYLHVDHEAKTGKSPLSDPYKGMSEEESIELAIQLSLETCMSLGAD